MGLRVAYLSGGKVHVREGDAPKRSFSSKFGEEIRERAVRSNQRSEWKRGGRGAAFAGAMLAGAGERDPAEMRIAISHIARGRERGELLYVLETDEISGVFALDLSSGKETRLLHTSDYRISALAVGPEGIACSLAGKAGTSNLAAMHLEGSDPQIITEGDSVDLHPTWDPSRDRTLIFQSAGRARDASGYAQGLGPASLQRLQIETAQIESVLESDKLDYLAPRFSPSGVLHAVRRPFRGSAPKPPWWRIPLDVLLIPWRLLSGIVGWLNFFTARYSGRTLMSGGQPDRDGPDERWLMMMGNVVDAGERAQRERATSGDEGYVPSSWELIAVEGDKPAVKAKSVGSFDFGDDGSIVYTDGAAVYALSASGEKKRLFKDDLIEQVLVV